MKEAICATLEKARYPHDIRITRLGGARGVLDKGGLQSGLTSKREPLWI